MDKKTVMELGSLSKEIDELIKNMSDDERAKFAQRIVALTVPNFDMKGGFESVKAVRKFIYKQLGKDQA